MWLQNVDNFEKMENTELMSYQSVKIVLWFAVTMHAFQFWS